MKLMIDIPEAQKKMVDAIVELSPQVENDLISAIRHGTPLSKNATNGDMFKALFPNYTYVGVCVLDENECILLHDVNYHWWNAPYKADPANRSQRQGIEQTVKLGGIHIPFPDIYNYKIKGIGDIGHSDKVIILDGEVEE